MYAKRLDLTNCIPSDILTLRLIWAGTVGLYPTGGLVVHGGGLDEVPGEKNFLESWQLIVCWIFCRIISGWNNIWLQVRNARGKIVEGAQEKRDQLIQTFKVISCLENFSHFFEQHILVLKWNIFFKILLNFARCTCTTSTRSTPSSSSSASSSTSLSSLSLSSWLTGPSSLLRGASSTFPRFLNYSFLGYGYGVWRYYSLPHEERRFSTLHCTTLLVYKFS